MKSDEHNEFQPLPIPVRNLVKILLFCMDEILTSDMGHNSEEH